MIRVLAAVACLTFFVSARAPSNAFDATLTSAERQAAVRAGKAFALAHQGYPVSSYVIYSVPDALTIPPGGGSVDGVVVATPFERVRYASYLAFTQNSAPGAVDIVRAAAADEVDFLIFAHSSANLDRTFLAKFGEATLLSAHDVRLAPFTQTSFGPALDFYNVAGKGRQPRWVGYETIRFDLGPLRTRGIDASRFRGALNFVDPYGRAYSLKFDLSQVV